MTEQLRPCPFCGTRPGRYGVFTAEESIPLAGDEEAFYVGHYVQCSVCGASSGRFDDEETAVEFWNEREGESAAE